MEGEVTRTGSTSSVGYGRCFLVGPRALIVITTANALCWVASRVDLKVSMVYIKSTECLSRKKTG